MKKYVIVAIVVALIGWRFYETEIKSAQEKCDDWKTGTVAVDAGGGAYNLHYCLKPGQRYEGVQATPEQVQAAQAQQQRNQTEAEERAAASGCPLPKHWTWRRGPARETL